MSDDQDFARMLEHDGHAQMRRGFDPGEKVRGTVVAITRNSILLDINAKSEGVLDRTLLEDDAGQVSVKVGDELDAYVVGVDRGEISLTTRMRGQDLESGELRNAFEAQIPVEGKVTGTNNAGLEVTIAGKRGFCPVSQIDVFRVEEKTVYVGQTLTFLILEYDDHNLVVSRRAYLQQQQEEQRQKLEEGLREGDNVTGTVRKIADFGVFVALGGADGLIPMGELAWERVSDAATIVKLGDQVTVKVIKLDWPNKRLTLSLRQAGSDPWDGIEAKLMVGMSYKGKVTRLADFGAFVQLEPGLEGLLHISKLAPGRRIGHPREVVDAGQELEVYIEGIDTERRRIALALEQRRPTAAAAAAGSDPAPPEAAAVGAEVKGTVVEVRPFGVFVKLSERQTGLLHISEIEAAGGGKSAMMRDFPVGKEVTVLVKAYKEGKVSLALPGAHNEDGDYRQFLSDGQQPPRDLGSLGGLFDNLKL